ncbi:hypothetical protein F3R34_18890 [Salmonella enterica subsp. enterica]|nr:hypothetical protein [Salmonella enterica subsp. enterica]
MSIKNDGHYFCRAGGNRPDGLNEPVTLNLSERHKNLRIVKIQHIFWIIEGSHMSHKICVWTELLGD